MSKIGCNFGVTLNSSKYESQTNITFQLESRKKTKFVTENVPIRMRGSMVFIRHYHTGYRIDAAKWDASKQRVKMDATSSSRHLPKSTDLNRYEGEIKLSSRNLSCGTVPLPNR